MYLKIGSYQHPLNEAALVISKTTLLTSAQIPYAVRNRWDITGYLQAADQPSLTTAIQALEAAYSIQGQDVGLYLDDNTPTAHRLISANCIGGVRIPSPPSYPDGSGAEYTTFRHFRIGIEAETATATAFLKDWVEVLNFTGTGGPRVVWMEIRNGPPQQQVVSEQTANEVTQTGRGVGYLTYPIPARPIWPNAELQEHRKISYKLPNTIGSGAARRLTDWEVTWSYTFKSDQQLSGAPTPRPFD
jgi:hypothetical protein